MQLSEEDGGELVVAIDNYSRSIQRPTSAVVAIMAAVDVRHLCRESLRHETLSAGTRRSLTQITNLVRRLVFPRPYRNSRCK